MRERLVDVVDPVLEHAERLGQLGEHLRMRPHEVDAVAQRRVLGERLVGERSDEHLHEPSFPLGHGAEVGRWAGHAGVGRPRGVRRRRGAADDRRLVAAVPRSAPPGGSRPPAASTRSDQLFEPAYTSARSRPVSSRYSARPMPGRSRRSERSSSTFAGQRDGMASRRLLMHDLGGLLVELHVAARRQERELRLHRSFDVAAGAAEQGPVAAVEAELLAVGADEVEHRAVRLVLRSAQASAELLEEQHRALGGSEHQHRVDVGEVDAFVEQVDGEHDLHVACRQVAQRRSLVRRGGSRPRSRRPGCRGG
ncbi:MAG: hypothetical protein V9E94_17270 [Microthrixaceae bacterium]